MDQGVINSFKSHYRRRLVNRYLAAIENRQDVNSIKINIREAIDMLTIAWRAVTSGTIANCFRKGGFVQGQRPAEQLENVQEMAEIAGIRRFFQASNLPENVFDALTVLEDYALQQQITRKTKQTKITELFDNMIKKENN